MHADYTYYKRDLNLKAPIISPLSYYRGDTPYQLRGWLLKCIMHTLSYGKGRIPQWGHNKHLSYNLEVGTLKILMHELVLIPSSIFEFDSFVGRITAVMATCNIYYTDATNS